MTSTRTGDAAVLRRIFRLHFWVGLFAAPVLVVLACTGLVILYSQPLDNWLNGDLLTVAQRSGNGTPRPAGGHCTATGRRGLHTGRRQPARCPRPLDAGRLPASGRSRVPGG